MKLSADYLVVGTGLTGAAIARVLADKGREVLVIERRSHIGGNVHDHVHPAGIRVHTYGPHYFRTNSDRVWDFVRRFSDFYPFVASVKSHVDGCYENWPVSASYILRAVGANWAPAFTGTPNTFEEAALSLMPRVIYEKFVKGYTEKQWGVPAASLSPELCTRFDVRLDDDPRLMRHKYQGLPKHGYASLMREMLSGIPLLLNCDFLRCRDQCRAHKLLVFTGPIDEFWNFELGHLQYRAQRREETYLPDVSFAQPCAQVNNPQRENGQHIRALEWKHMMPANHASRIRGTVITRETPATPTDPGEYEYPIPDRANAELYARYRARTRTLPKVLICGRLGEYRYYDMDQAIERALLLSERLTR